MNQTEMLKQNIVDKRLTLATLMYNASSQMTKEEVERRMKAAQESPGPGKCGGIPVLRFLPQATQRHSEVCSVVERRSAGRSIHSHCTCSSARAHPIASEKRPCCSKTWWSAPAHSQRSHRNGQLCSL